WQAMRGEVDESEDNRLADEEATGESIRGRLIGNYEEAPPGEAKGDSGDSSEGAASGTRK
ncbi:MAG: hypothetical protein AAF849_06415, partial [Bacteroidota bacterium]